MPVDPQRVAAIVRHVVDTEILPRFQNLKAGEVRSKSSPGDLVTEADVSAERALGALLAELLPGSKIVGEEAVFADQEVLDSLTEDAPVWVIDPVDGTGNFVRNDARFACVVALVQSGATKMGWIDACVERQTFIATRGGGVTLPDGSKARLDPGEKADEPLKTFNGQAGGKTLRKRLQIVSGTVDWVGSAARTYLDLVTGRIDFAAFTRLHVWDHAAGVLMVSEAGGAGRLANGQPYAPTLREHESPLLLARNELVWTRIAEAVV